MSFLETKSPTSDSCDESLTTHNTVQDTSSILNRPPLPPTPTTRTIHIPDPSSVLQCISISPHKIPTATKTPRKTPIPALPKNFVPPSTSQTPTKSIPEHTASSPSELSLFTFSQLYPILERLKSTTASFSTDLYFKDKDSGSTASTRVPRHSYNLRSQSRRLSPSLPYQVTSGFESASLLSEDAQTISDIAANFSRVYSPSSIPSDSSIQLPECFLEEYSRPPTSDPQEYPIRVKSKIIPTLNEDPRYTVLPARSINNSSLSNPRKQRELRRLQDSSEDYK